MSGVCRRALLALLVLSILSGTRAGAEQSGTIGTTGTVGTLGTIEDRLAIQERLAQYSYLWDSKDSSGFAGLFTVDGIMERWVGGTLVSGSRVVGRQAILDYATESHRGLLADRQTRHHMSALVFLELSTDRAVTENMALITHQTAGDSVPFISGSGIYRNTWQKTDEGWKIAERVLLSDRFTSQ